MVACRAAPHSERHTECHLLALNPDWLVFHLGTCWQCSGLRLKIAGLACHHISLTDLFSVTGLPAIISLREMSLTNVSKVLAAVDHLSPRRVGQTHHFADLTSLNKDFQPSAELSPVSLQSTEVSWDFDVCSSLKSWKTMLWCHKAQLYSLFWSLTIEIPKKKDANKILINKIASQNPMGPWMEVGCIQCSICWGN